jgi:hypothetical protein
MRIPDDMIRFPAIPHGSFSSLQDHSSLILSIYSPALMIPCVRDWVDASYSALFSEGS